MRPVASAAASHRCSRSAPSKGRTAARMASCAGRCAGRRWVRDVVDGVRAGAGVSCCTRGRHDQHHRAVLGRHLGVVGVPVVVGAARGGEHLAEQEAQTLRVDRRMRVVGPDQLGAALDRRPLPSRPHGDGDLGPGTQVPQLGGAVGHERQHVVAGHGVGEDAGVDHRRLDGAVAPERRDRHQEVLRSGQCHHIAQGRHRRPPARRRRSVSPVCGCGARGRTGVWREAGATVPARCVTLWCGPWWPGARGGHDEQHR